MHIDKIDLAEEQRKKFIFEMNFIKQRKRIKIKFDNYREFVHRHKKHRSKHTQQEQQREEILENLADDDDQRNLRER